MNTDTSNLMDCVEIALVKMNQMKLMIRQKQRQETNLSTADTRIRNAAVLPVEQITVIDYAAERWYSTEKPNELRTILRTS